MPTEDPGPAPTPDALEAPADLAGAEELRAAFPGVVCWWGPHTRRWWAVLPIGRPGRLVEGATTEDLGRAVEVMLRKANA